MSEFFKSFQKLIYITLLAVFMFILNFTNPSKSEHRNSIINKYSKITNMNIVDNTLGKLSTNIVIESEGGLDYKNYKFFSLGYLDGKLNSIGSLNQILIKT